MLEFIFIGLLGVIMTAMALTVILLIAISPWIINSYIAEKRSKYGPYQLNVMDTKIKEMVFFGLIGGFILYPALPAIMTALMAILIVPLILIGLAVLMLLPGIICDFEKKQDVYKFKKIRDNAYEIGFFAVVIGLIISII